MTKKEQGFTPAKYKQGFSSDKVGNSTGFTLTETMVVVVVFTAVMSLSLIVFLASIRTQRFALHHQRIVTETSYALNKIEEMVREGEDVNDGNIESIVENLISTESIDIVTAKVEDGGKRKTILLETKTDIDEERVIDIKLQTTVLEP